MNAQKAGRSNDSKPHHWTLLYSIDDTSSPAKYGWWWIVILFPLLDLSTHRPAILVSSGSPVHSYVRTVLHVWVNICAVSLWIETASHHFDTEEKPVFDIEWSCHCYLDVSLTQPYLKRCILGSCRSNQSATSLHIIERMIQCRLNPKLIISM